MESIKSTLLVELVLTIVTTHMMLELLKKPEVVAATITGIIAIAALFITFRKDSWEKQKAQRELFEHFNKRFDALNEALNTIRIQSISGGNIPATFQVNSKLFTWQDVVQDYLNLCAEEYLWHRKKLVDRDVWNAWKDGMLYYLQAPVFDEHFEEEKKYPVSYYGLFGVLNWPKPKKALKS